MGSLTNLSTRLHLQFFGSGEELFSTVEIVSFRIARDPGPTAEGIEK
jgi:hypothetical protein